MFVLQQVMQLNNRCKQNNNLLFLFPADKSLMKTFNFVHNEIGFSHEHILRWPNILRQRVSILRPRYQFLKFLKRDQFDPLRENYVSPQALATTQDLEFCNTVAKVPIKLFNDFLKTLWWWISSSYFCCIALVNSVTDEFNGLSLFSTCSSCICAL